MSPTVESPSYKDTRTSLGYNVSLARSNSSESSSDISSTNDSDNSNGNLNNNSLTKTESAAYNYQFNKSLVESPTSRGDAVSSGGLGEGIRARVGVPRPLIGGLRMFNHSEDNSATDVTNRSSFPSGASVSIPTSTTALDYLLHRHGMDRTSEEEDVSGNNEISLKKAGSNNDSLSTSLGSSDTTMTKTLSAADSGSLLGQTGSSRSSRSSVAQQFFTVEPCVYTHRIFVRAAKIFEVLRDPDDELEEIKASRRRQGLQVVEKEKIPEMDFLDPQEQVKTFELTFATLKFQKLFHTILDHSGFFSHYSNLRDDYSLVCIVLYDLQSRKFQRRTPFPGEKLDEVCSEIENALLERKTRLQSHIAKERIKNNAPSIEYLLPEQVRNKDETKIKSLIYLWVNQIRATIEEVVMELKSEGFTQVEEEKEVAEATGYVFRVDPHCPDLLVFPPHLDMYFKDARWVKRGELVQQDKSSCLAPQSVDYLLGPDCDMVHVNAGTGLTTAHLASLLKKKSPQSHIWAFSLDGPDRARKAMKNLDFFGVKNAKILPEDFLSVDPDESRFKSVKLVLITANCSKSAISNPVQFIVSEGEDMRFLGEMSKSETDMACIGELMVEHEKLLRHAFKFPRVQAVVYTTRSRHEAENEQVVTRVLEYVNATTNSKKVPFKVTPPVLPFTAEEVDSGASGVDGRFVRFLPTDRTNGCFVAVMSREPEDPKEAARSAIAKARSKGLLGKAKSMPQSMDSEDSDTASGNISSHGGKHSKGVKGKLKGTTSAPEAKSGVTNGIRSKIGGHKSPAAIGARLYQAGLISKMEQQAQHKARKPEHLKVIKHPAPFRG